MEGDDIQARIDRLDFARASFKDECAISKSGRIRLAQEVGSFDGDFEILVDKAQSTRTRACRTGGIKRQRLFDLSKKNEPQKQTLLRRADPDSLNTRMNRE